MKCPICNNQNATRCDDIKGMYCEDCDKVYSGDYLLGFYAGVGKETQEIFAILEEKLQVSYQKFHEVINYVYKSGYENGLKDVQT